MAKVKISRKDGTSSPYFWSDKENGDPSRRTVYKQTADGVKRMKGVHFDSVANRIHKH